MFCIFMLTTFVYSQDLIIDNQTIEIQGVHYYDVVSITNSSEIVVTDEVKIYCNSFYQILC